MAEQTAEQTAEHCPPDSGVAARLCWALAVAVLAGGALTVLAPGALHGTAAMNGSARGTALAMAAFGVPALVATTILIATTSTAAISARAAVIRIGTVAFFVYNSLMLLFGTPFNAWFLVYVAMLGLSLAALIALGAPIDAPALAQRFTARRRARGIATYLLVIVVANTLIWLRAVVPALAHTDDPPFLAGTGLITNPIYVQDLSFWLPLAGLSAVWLWNRRPWGVVLGGAFLWMWVLEGLCVALDQWFGSRADPQSSVVSSSMVVPFLILAAGSLVALTALAHSDSGDEPAGP